MISSSPPPNPFSAIASAYARHRPRYPAALFDFLAELAPGRRLAWDCATGNGQAACDLAARFETVLASDISGRQLAHALPQAGVHYAQMAAERPAFPDAVFDLVAVPTALHWLDVEAFWGAARRVAVPGGIVAAWVYFQGEVDPAVDRVARRYADEILAEDWRPHMRDVRDGYRGLSFPFEELPAPSFAVELDWSLADYLGYLGTWSPRAGHLRRTGQDPVVLIEPDMTAAWGPPATRRRVRLPLALRVGRVRNW
jgi:hypothetical protein